MIDRHTTLTSKYSGQCESAGYSEGQPGQFHYPVSVIRDNNDDRKLLVTDHENKAIRTVDINTGAVGTFIKSDILSSISHMTQDDNGDLYVTAGYTALYRITYSEMIITLITGSPGKVGYRDNSLLDSLFYNPYDLAFIGNQTLLVADTGSDKIRLVDMNADRVSTLNLCSGCLAYPSSLLITNNSLFVGQWQKIRQFICENTEYT